MQARGRGPGGGHFPAFRASPPGGAPRGPGDAPVGLQAAWARVRRPQDVPRRPQATPKPAQGGLRTTPGRVFGGFWVAKWTQFGTKMASGSTFASDSPPGSKLLFL